MNKVKAKTQQSIVVYTVAGTAAFAAVAYELLLASYATFLMGASIFQYSLVLSLMMASMGLGALFTRKANQHSATYFLWVETALALLSIIALPLLYSSYALNLFTQPLLMLFVLLIGLCIGMEIPLLNQTLPGAESLPNLLFFDYVGGFLGGVLFPLLLLPRLGFFKVSALLAIVNILASLVFLYALRHSFKSAGCRKWGTTLGILGLVAILYLGLAQKIRTGMENHFFGISELSRRVAH